MRLRLISACRMALRVGAEIADIAWADRGNGQHNKDVSRAKPRVDNCAITDRGSCAQVSLNEWR